MKFLLSSLLLFLAAVAQATSSTGSRLLSIWEDVEEQKLYSKFIGDLESKTGITYHHLPIPHPLHTGGPSTVSWVANHAFINL